MNSWRQVIKKLALGRFITPDSLIPDSTISQAYNRYMYVYGNPVRYLDPSGKSIIDDISGSVGDFFDDPIGSINDGWNNVTNWFKDNVSWTKISSGITDAANAVVNYNFRANVINPTGNLINKAGSIHMPEINSAINNFSGRKNSISLASYHPIPFVMEAIYSWFDDDGSTTSPVYYGGGGQMENNPGPLQSTIINNGPIPIVLQIPTTPLQTYPLIPY